LCMYSVSVRDYTQSHATGVIVGTWVGIFVLILMMFCFKDVWPLNMVLLLTFTVLMSFAVGLVCGAYYNDGAGDTVLTAFVITLGVFVVLTLFTMQSRADWSWLGAPLVACLWCLILFGIICGIFGFRTGFLYSLFGAIVFSLFIIYDTYMITKRYGYDDYVIASIELYLDIVNLFLFILALLGRKK